MSAKRNGRIEMRRYSTRGVKHGPLDIEILRTGVLLSAHESRHPLGGGDEIDEDLNALALALTTQGDIVYRAAAVNTLARLAAATAGQLLITGGAGANPSYSWHHLLDNAPDADHTGAGLTSVDTVGENVVAGEVLYMAATGKYLKANAGAVGTMPAKVLAMEDIAADAAGLLLHEGYYRDESWAWVLGAGEANLLFVTTVAGDLVQFAAKPAAAGNQVQVCGYVVTAKIIYWDPSYEMVEIA